MTRKLRLNKAHGKVLSNYRDRHITYYHLFGNWAGGFSNVKIIQYRRSFKPIVNRLNSFQKDVFQITDEYTSTVTCNGCCSRTTPQVFRRNGNLVRIKRAVVYYNTSCLKRKNNNSTTTNRDRNGAQNIALIGFSSMISKDGRPLPPFRRGCTKENK
jgi:hypothetical protein